MTIQLNKGDVCSLEVVVQTVLEDRAVVGIAGCDDPYAVPQDYLTLIRRAPVDLATCEIPEEGVPVRGGSGEASPSVMVARHGKMAWLKWPGGDYTSALVQYLRPLDAHAPSDGKGCYLSDLDYYIRQCGDASETAVSVQRLREWRDSFNALYYGPRPDWAPNIDAPAPKGEVERLRAALEGIRQYGLDTMSGRVDGPDDRAWQRAAVVEMTKRARLALNPEAASAAPPAKEPQSKPDVGPLCQPKPGVIFQAHNATAPTCPPGHVLINGHVVPEPMYLPPDFMTPYWKVLPDGSVSERKWLACALNFDDLPGGIHSTEANARAHAEAIIALSAGEGV